MTTRTASCPNCGAPITFRWSGAVQTTCDYCRAILVRHDVDLAQVGTVADVPPDVSPIQRGTRGAWRGRAFEVVGRIRYRHGRGRWSEWHLRFADGESGWLSDAQLDWAITVQVPLPARFPAPQELFRGRTVRIGDETFTVTAVTSAGYEGVEGELPFTTYERREARFVDLRTPTARFATLDGSERPPLLFVGETVTWDALGLTDVRTFEGWPAP